MADDPKTIGDKDLPPLRTFKQDLAESLDTEGTSMASIAMQEEQKREREALAGEGEERTSKRFVFIIGALVFVGAMVLSSALFLWQRKPPAESVPTGILPAPLIYAESRETFELDGKTPGAAYRDVAAKLTGESLPEGATNEIILTRAGSSLPTQDFFSALGIAAPDKLIRFVDKKFMLGSYSFRILRGFIVLQSFSYNTVLSELLAWEKDMPAALVPLLTGKEWPTGPSAPDSNWRDAVVRNIDSRELNDNQGKVLLLYAFLPARLEDGRQLLIIAPDKETFVELLQRSQSPRPVLR